MSEVGKNFDEARQARIDSNRTFSLGGIVFERKPSVTPEALEAYDNMKRDMKPEDSMKIIDDTVLQFIVDRDGAHEKYRKLRAMQEPGPDEEWTIENTPLSIEDTMEVVRWLVQEEVGRPTEAPSPSTAGRVSTIPPSGERSSSRGARRTA